MKNLDRRAGDQGEKIDATLDPILARALFYKKGRSLFLQLGGKEVEYDTKFQLYLQTKLANQHYSPEIAARRSPPRRRGRSRASR